MEKLNEKIMDFDIADLGIIKYDTLFATLGDNIEHINIKYNGKVYTEKDLEILEILKPYIRIYKDVLPNGTAYCYYFLNGIETNKETYEKVNEWLENKNGGTL